jgi:hypothetical protein
MMQSKVDRPSIFDVCYILRTGLAAPTVRRFQLEMCRLMWRYEMQASESQSVGQRWLPDVVSQTVLLVHSATYTTSPVLGLVFPSPSYFVLFRELLTLST